MKALDFIINFASNLRQHNINLGPAQIMLVLASGKTYYRDMVSMTKIHPNAITNMIRDLVEQGLVDQNDSHKPHTYFLTPEGERTLKALIPHD